MRDVNLNENSHNAPRGKNGNGNGWHGKLTIGSLVTLLGMFSAGLYTVVNEYNEREVWRKQVDAKIKTLLSVREFEKWVRATEHKNTDWHGADVTESKD